MKVSVLLLLSLVCGPPLPARAEPCKEAPKLVADKQRKVSLFLPDTVLDLIHRKLPGLRVPDQTDMKGLWATEAEPGSLPYFAEGNFNGDGRQDFAFLLTNDKEYWLAIFHRETDCSYSIGYRTGGYADVALQNVFLRTVRKEEQEHIAEGKNLRFETDALDGRQLGEASG